MAKRVLAGPRRSYKRSHSSSAREGCARSTGGPRPRSRRGHRVPRGRGTAPSVRASSRLTRGGWCFRKGHRWCAGRRRLRRHERLSLRNAQAGWRLGSLHTGIHGRTRLVRRAIAEAASHSWVYSPGPSQRGALAAVLSRPTQRKAPGTGGESPLAEDPRSPPLSAGYPRFSSHRGDLRLRTCRQRPEGPVQALWPRHCAARMSDPGPPSPTPHLEVCQETGPLTWPTEPVTLS